MTLLQEALSSTRVAVPARRTACAIVALVGLSTTPAQAQSVTRVPGEIPSNFEVGHLGSATFTIPIHVAPGIQDLQPELSLRYDSGNNSNGPVGLGFQLTGLSSIRRCGKTIARDGVNRGIDLTNGDRLCLDGQALLSYDRAETDDGYWQANSRYRTAEESGIRVEMRGACTASQGCTFVASHPGGRALFYEDVSQGFPQRNWVLRRVRDKHGNEMTIDYLVDHHVTYPSEITYSGRSVAFSYGSRSQAADNEVVFVAGVKAVQRRRLETIEARLNGVTFKSYRLSYESSPASAHSRLVEVLECNARGSCLDPITLEWNHGARDAQFERKPLPLPIYRLDVYNDVPVFGDFDGDGKTDILAQPKGSRSSQAYLFYQTERWFRTVNLAATNLHNDPGAILIPGDYNGDGRTDFVRQEKNGWDDDTFDTFSVFFARGEGDGFTRVRTDNAHIQRAASFDRGCRFFPGDFNGDGMTDLLRQEHSGWDGDFQNTIQVWLSQGNGEFEIITPGRNFGGDPLQHLLMYDLGMRVILGDFNGDGLSDFAAHDVNSHNEATHWLRLFFSNGDGTFTQKVPNDEAWQWSMQGQFVNLVPGDYNGDGKTDFLRQEKGRWDNDDIMTFSVHLSRGDGNFEVISHAASGVDALAHYDRGVNLIPGDFNGDGVDDFIRQNRGGLACDDTSSSFSVFYGRGDGTFFRVTPSGDIYQKHLRDTRSCNKRGLDSGVQLLTGDFDGDGRTDFLTQSHSYPSSIHSTPGMSIYYSDPLRRLPDHLVASIHSGNGLETRLRYERLSRDEAYDARHISPDDGLRELRGPIWVVAGVTRQAEGQPSTAESRSYRYAGAILDNRGLGFLGFEQVTIDSLEAGTREVRRYLANRTFKGRLAREELRDRASGALLRERVLTWTRIPQTPTKIELTRLAEERQRAYEGTAFRDTHTSYGYDAFGNPVFERRDDGQDGSVHICRTFHNDDNLGTLHRLLTEEVNSDCTFSNGACACTGQTFARVEFVYDATTPNGKLVEKRRLDTHRGRLEVERLGYDAFGNLVETIDAAGVKVATTYDSQLHTYPERMIRDPDGARLESTFVYDHRYGILIESRDPAGGVEMRQLDDFGRLVEVGVAGGAKPYEAEERRRYARQGPLQVVEVTQLDEGRPARVLRIFTDHLGREVRQEREAEGGIVVQAIEWDRAGRKARESRPHLSTDPAESVAWTAYSYDARGRLTELRSPTGLVTSVSYGFGGAECAPSEQRVELVQRDAMVGQPSVGAARTRVECRNTRGAATRQVFRHGSDHSEQLLQYDALGRIIAAWSQDGSGRPVGSVTEHTYDSLGRRVVTEHSQRGRTEFTYLGDQLRSKTTALGTTTYIYDTAGRKIRERLPDGTEHRLTYDGPGPFGRARLSEVSYLQTHGASGARAYTYDRKGRVVREQVTIDGRQFVLGYAYLSDDSLAEVTYPDGSVLEVRHDTLGNVRELLVDEVSYVRYGHHTALGQPVSVSFANGVQTGYSYDDVGRLTQVRTIRSHEVLMDRGYGWNVFDEVESISDARHPTQSQTFSYDERGYLMQATGPYGTLRYAYDAAGNLVEKGGITFTYEGDRPTVSSAGESFSYDRRGNRTLKQSGLRSTRYAYSPLDQMTEVTSVTCSSTIASSCAEEVVGSFVYDASGARVMKVDASGVVSLYVSPLYEVTVFPDRPELHTKYIPGPSGRIAAISDAMTAGASGNSEASAFGPLSSLFHRLNPELVGHALALAFVIASAWFWMRAADPRTRLGRARSFAVRALRALRLIDGRVEARGMAAFGTQFMRTRRRSAAALPTCASYLVLVTTGCGAPPTGEMTRVRGGEYGLQRLSNGLLHASRSLDPGENGLGYPVAGTHFFHADHLGSSTLVTDALGDQVAKAFYKPYGEISRDFSSGQDVFRSKFTGKEWDDGADLYYFEARHYDPYIGRFVQADVLLFGSDGRLTSDLNRYAYAANNPVKYTDPSGRAILTSLLIGAVIGAAISATSTAIVSQAETGRVDWRAVGIAFGIGLVTGAAAGAAGAGAASSLSGAFAKAVTEGVVSGALGTFSASIFEQLALEGEVDWRQVGIETLVGTLTGGGVEGVGSKVAKLGSQKHSPMTIRSQAAGRMRDKETTMLEAATEANLRQVKEATEALGEELKANMSDALRDPLQAGNWGFSVPWAAKLKASDVKARGAYVLGFMAARGVARVVADEALQQALLAGAP